MQTQSFNRQAYADAFKVQHSRYERYSYKLFKKALDEQISPVIAHVKAYGGITDSIADMLVKKSPIETAYKACYTKVGVLNAQWTLTQVNRIAKKSLFSEAWRSLMEKFFNDESSQRVSDVTETTREQIRKVLADSTDLPTSQRADYITSQLGAEDFNRNRALMIARTESTTAANYGALLGGDSSDYETGKVWLPIIDTNTRPDHADMDGQPAIGMDEYFEVGGYMMAYPGDISAPAKEVVNCRCSLGIVPLSDERGLPILKVA